MKKISHLTRTSLLLITLFAVDKGLAFLRQVIVTRQFKLSFEFDAFNAANNLPDLLFALISGGAMGVAFIPVLTGFFSQGEREKAWNLFSRVANLVFLTTGLIAILIAIFADQIVSSRIGIAPGFSPQQRALIADLMRLNLIATLIFSISGLVMGSLQANQHFLLPALAPLMYNLGQIFGALVLAPRQPYTFGPVTLPALGLGVHGLVYGVILGAAFHLGIQIPGLFRYKFSWLPSVNFLDRDVIRVLALIGPRILTMFFIQLVFLARDNLASRLGTEGAISALTIGWMIMQVPETILGTAIAIAFLPTLSKYAARQDWATFRQMVERPVRILIALTLPIAIILSVGLRPLVQIVYGLDAQSADLLTWTARIYLLGLTGHSVLEVISRAFYARKDALRPLAASALNTAVFIVFGMLSVTFFSSWGAPGIALIELAFTGEALLLFFWLNRLLPEPVTAGSSLLRAVLGAAAGGLAAYGLMAVLPFSDPLSVLLALTAGSVLALPFVWKEVSLLFRL